MNFETRYLGLKLKNPLVLAASPLSKEIETTKRMEDAGASAVVMYSLFEEQIANESKALDHFINVSSESYAEALSYFPEPEQYHNLKAEEYLDQIRNLKKAVDIPIIGSLNGVSKGGWMEYAKKIEEAGADALELNIYYIAADPEMSSGQVEEMYIEDLKAAKESVSIPVSVKIGPFFSAFANFAKRLEKAGADGLVLFNRFYQPDIDLENKEVASTLELSNGFEKRLPLRWIAMLRPHLKCSLAATTGIHHAEDVIKMVMAGADVTMMASTLLKNGSGHLASMLQGIKTWMEENEYESIEEMKGSMSSTSVADASTFERANYIHILQSYKTDGID